MKTLTWPQVVLCLGLLGGLIAAGKYLPHEAATVVQVIAFIFAFFRDPKDPPPPNTPSPPPPVSGAQALVLTPKEAA